MSIENNQPPSTQGNNPEKEAQWGGTTNLSLDQLKKERGITNPAEDNPNGITDQDDLNEIRVGDDIDEPDIEEYQPDEQIDDSTEDQDKTTDESADGSR